MKIINVYTLGLTLLCASLYSTTYAEDTKFWLWGVMLPIIEKDCMSCGTLVRKGPHGLITESFHVHKTNLEKLFDNPNQDKSEYTMENVRGELSTVSIHYCYFLDTKRDIHPFLGVGVGRSSFTCSSKIPEEEFAELQQPFTYWKQLSIKPSIGIHFGQNYWVSLLLQVEGSLDFIRWPRELCELASDFTPEKYAQLPYYDFSPGITIALAFKIF